MPRGEFFVIVNCGFEEIYYVGMNSFFVIRSVAGNVKGTKTRCVFGEFVGPEIIAGAGLAGPES